MFHSPDHTGKRALITGITGQDGSYLSELLLEKGYEVHGIVRRIAYEDPGHRLWRIKHLLPRIILHSGSIESFPSIFRIIQTIKPQECYHLAAQSFVSFDFEDEFSTFSTNVNGTHFVLAAIKEICPTCRFYFAGSSEMFGKTPQVPQDETTEFAPRSVYGISKLAGFHLTHNYRDNYGIHASSGILYNHESPRRGYEYVTRKISSGVAKIALGKTNSIALGDLNASRDWGYAKDYVKAIWMMVQQKDPGDFVIATGNLHTVRDFVEIAFSIVQLPWEKHVILDPRLVRPNDGVTLLGNSEKARRVLNWSPSIDFEKLVRIMVEEDLDLEHRSPAS